MIGQDIMLAVVDSLETRTPRYSDLPAALASLHPGQVVLRLGGPDRGETTLVADSVGPAGKVYDLVRTDRQSGAEAPSFADVMTDQSAPTAKQIEQLAWNTRRLPLPGSSVDHVIFCFAMNQTADKDRFMSEAFRVLKPGGRLTMTEVVLRGSLSPDLRGATEYAFRGVKGALDEVEWCLRLDRIGFSEISLEPWHVYRVQEIRRMLTDAGLDAERYRAPLEGRIVHAHIYARKARRLFPFPLVVSTVKFLMGIQLA